MSDIFSQQSAKPESSGEPQQTRALADNSAETGIASLLTHSSGEQPLIPMLNRLMDLELPLSIALGRSSLPIRDVLKMTPGSLIELDRKIGDLVDLVVHGTTIAKGEVVSVKGNYGVRIKEIISRQDRLALQGQR
ncbi:MAG: flagellar motor switch protein FliN [Acidobacteriaceae bacterium]|nr:flagellar motor switch protein FliN [Acidobacteriaceae bacterium]MBV9499953.1 flagellar motor switch protein FliN [Acidobacteriaceae bacterium]